MSGSQPPPGAADSPESIFADWLARHERGDEADLDALCHGNEAHERRLRELHMRWSELDEIQRRFGQVGSIAQRLETLYGSEVDPKVELADEGSTGGDFTAKALGRLAVRGSGSSRYRLEGEIASGGMGAVLRVWDEDLRRFLAMKVMLTKSARRSRNEDASREKTRLARFLEEAQVTGQLDHPGIVPVHEMGLDAEGRVYFTMKLVKGRTLKEILDLVELGAEGWTQVRALGVLLKVCEAMRYAHDKNVIHRDLKPANIMVGRYGEVYVMDWGLARILSRADEKDIRVVTDSSISLDLVRLQRREPGDQGSGSPLVTMDGDVVGTPAYMPPEQATGRIADMGPHSDVFALGAMLYHLLASQMPYVPRGESINNVSLWHRVREGPPRPLRELAPDAAEELIAICEKAMDRDPQRRYRTMTALGADLAAFLEGRVVRAYETGAWAEARKWVRRNWKLAGALATALSLLVAGLIVSSSLYVRAQSNALQAERKTQEAEQNLALAQRNEREALEERQKVLRLSDVKRLQEYEAEAALLWPAHPDKAGDMRDWLARATALAANLPRHGQTLAALRARASLQTADAQGARHWRFEDTETQWQHDVLAELVEGLERFAVPDPYVGSIASMQRRLASAETIEERSLTGIEAAAAWRQAIEAIERSAEYGGLRIVPQLGLLPLGADPRSGLWEFAQLETGEPVRRDAQGRLELTDLSAMVLVLVPGGSFSMGAQRLDEHAAGYDPEAQDLESPVRELSLAPFFVAKHEMTQGQWRHLMGSDPSRWRAGSGENGPITLRNPVESVTWIECGLVLARMGLSLPTEAQWEYAARGGTSTIFSTGDDAGGLDGFANIADRTGKQAGTIWSEDTRAGEIVDGYAVHAPVGSFLPNPFGLHDVHGNVWEWCRDSLGPYRPELRDGGVEPPESADGFRTIRGGAFYFPSTYARCSRRYGRAPDLKLDFLGVRPARELAR